ncbi:MAG: S49 family peptidase, partial [Pseudomonadota bacterium]
MGKIIRFILRTIWGFSALFGLAVLALMAGAGWIFYQSVGPDDVELPSGQSVLALSLPGDLEQPTELAGPAGDVLSEFVYDPQIGLVHRYMAIDALIRAADDPQIAGLRVQLDNDGLTMAMVDELISVLDRFRASGKQTEVFVTSMPVQASSAIALASSFHHVTVEQHGFFAPSGYAIEMPFAADFVDWLGLNPELAQRHEFKGGVDPLLHKTMPLPLRRNLQALVDDLYGQLRGALAEGRDLADLVVDAIIDRSPLSAREMLDFKLADAVMSYDEWLEEDVVSALGLYEYMAVLVRRDQMVEDQALQVGVLPLSGVLAPSGGPGSNLLDSELAFRRIDALREDRELDAVLLLIDSPGGDFITSWRLMAQIRALADSGVPVVALIADQAASGGYMLALAGDVILASASAITGSIGVYGGKISLQPLMDHIGVHWQRVSRGRHAGLWSPFFDFSPTARDRLEALIDDSYRHFTELVAQRRKLAPDELDLAARGRVFTANQA